LVALRFLVLGAVVGGLLLLFGAPLWAYYVAFAATPLLVLELRRDA
jgi:hypothetical protein